jgi:glutathione peroxidase
MENSIYDFEVKTIDGETVSMDRYRGKTLLIVNTASQCGFTPQYTGLDALYRKLQDKDLVVLGFPCNQFGEQEPGDEKEIKEFCSLRFNVSFPMFAKVDVNGDAAHPLYKFLKKESKGILGTEAVKWNFTKFLVDKTGKVLERYAPNVKPEDLEGDLAKVL